VKLYEMLFIIIEQVAERSELVRKEVVVMAARPTTEEEYQRHEVRPVE
jgi:hypothetical protein